jgi:hypothetical protein
VVARARLLLVEDVVADVGGDSEGASAGGDGEGASTDGDGERLPDSDTGSTAGS